MHWLLSSRARASNLYELRRGFLFEQRFCLVNVKLKWVKDKELDAVVVRDKDLRAVCNLVSVVSSASNQHLPIYKLTKHRGQLGLPHDLKISTFLRRYPNIFSEEHAFDSAGTRFPCFRLTPKAWDLHQEELKVSELHQSELLDRLCKLLMLTRNQMLPIPTIDQLRWDMGLPYDYDISLIPRYPNLFSLVQLPDDRIALKLVSCDQRLVVSYLERNASEPKKEMGCSCLEFPVKFTRGFGLKRKCMKWLEEWQSLPYTSPYIDASHLDPRTDVSEKRNVGVFHELLHLSIQKRMERKNVSNLRQPLSLPQKFTKVFERHPGIFYISMKCNTQTVILREAYDHQKLLERHPLVDVREKFSSMMREGFLGKSKGLYKRNCETIVEEELPKRVYRYSSEEELQGNVLSEYESKDHFLSPS